VAGPPLGTVAFVTFVTLRTTHASDECSTVARTSPKEEQFMPEGYCVKERKKVEIKDPQQVTMKNGRPAIQGTCPDCGTKIFKIGKLN
jgi:hypothetical protein